MTDHALAIALGIICCFALPPRASGAPLFTPGDPPAGSLKWSFIPRNSAGQSGSVQNGIITRDDGTLFFTADVSSNASDGGTKLYALNARDGTVKWTKGVVTDIIGRKPALSKDEKLAYISTGDVRGPGYVGLQAFSTADGALVWQYSKSGCRSENTPVVSKDGQTVFIDVLTNLGDPVKTLYSRVVALNASTGGERWVFERENPEANPRGVFSPPANSPNGSTIYFRWVKPCTSCYDVSLVALSAEDGSLKWEIPSTYSDPWDGIHGELAPPTVSPDGRTVYFTTNGHKLGDGGLGGDIFAVDAADGSAKWRTHNATCLNTFSALVMSPEGGKLFCGKQWVGYNPGVPGWGANWTSNDITAISAKDGRVLGRVQLPFPESGDTQLQSVDQLVGSKDGSTLYAESPIDDYYGEYIYAIDISTMRIQWRFTNKNDSQTILYAPPIISNDGKTMFRAAGSQMCALNLAGPLPPPIPPLPPAPPAPPPSPPNCNPASTVVPCNKSSQAKGDADCKAWVKGHCSPSQVKSTFCKLDTHTPYGTCHFNVPDSTAHV
jgi:outer membrane protein assembly factor BamB